MRRFDRVVRSIPPFRAGLIAIAITALAVYLAFGGSLPWESSFQLRAVVRSGNELHSRTPIRVAGVDVGKVAEVKRGPGGTAIVTMNIEDRALPIHSDATLKVRPRIFLEGNFFVDLQPGTPSAPTVHSGYTIPLSATAASGSVSLAWGAASDNVGVTAYSVYRGTASGFVPAPSNRVGQVAGLAFTDSGLAPGTYYYVVRARSARGRARPRGAGRPGDGARPDRGGAGRPPRCPRGVDARVRRRSA